MKKAGDYGLQRKPIVLVEVVYMLFTNQQVLILKRFARESSNLQTRKKIIALENMGAAGNGYKTCNGIF
jgi:hypothetical protein